MGVSFVFFFKNQRWRYNHVPEGVKDMHVLRGFSVFSFIETVQIRNYFWVSKETKLHVWMFLLFLYGFIINIMRGCQTQTSEFDTKLKALRSGVVAKPKLLDLEPCWVTRPRCYPRHWFSMVVRPRHLNLAWF
jgi:hypothetical protein